MWYFNFVIYSQILIVLYAGYIQDKLTNSKFIQILRIDGECRGKNLPKKSFHQGIKSGPWGTTIAKSTLIITEDLADNLKMTITINRCLSRENLDSCEEVHKYKDLDYCQSINPDNLIVSQSPFVMHYQPKFKCPIKKGIYRAYNTTLTMAPFALMLLDNYYYRLTCELYPPKGNRLLYRLAAESKLVSKRQN